MSHARYISTCTKTIPFALEHDRAYRFIGARAVKVVGQLDAHIAAKRVFPLGSVDFYSRNRAFLSPFNICHFQPPAAIVVCSSETGGNTPAAALFRTIRLSTTATP